MKLFSKDHPNICAVPVDQLDDGSTVYAIVDQGKIMESVILHDSEIGDEWYAA